MDIFKMANQLAKNMSDDDKGAIENMDMEKMISHVTKNVFKMMGTGENSGGIPDIMKVMGSFNAKETGSDSDSDTDPQEMIYPKTRDICFDLNVDLEDFFMGKKKKLNVKRKRIIVDQDGKQRVVEEKKKLVIPIEKGMKDEQQIRFQGEADQIPGYSPGDIVITLIENEHPVFQRDGDNLLIIKNINLYELYDITFDIKHLDGTVLRITKNSDDSLHLNDSLRKISRQGMPIYKSDDKYGDLFVRFNLVIPKSLDAGKLKLFKEIFHLEPVELSTEGVSKNCILENISEADLEDLDYSESDSESGSESDSISSLESEPPSPPKKNFPKRR
jgi:DnaJ-class molecular chaperone